jgi:hypothetical protein
MTTETTVQTVESTETVPAQAQETVSTQETVTAATETVATESPKVETIPTVQLAENRAIGIDRLLASVPDTHTHYSFIKNAFHLFAAVQTANVTGIAASMPNPLDDEQEILFTNYTVELTWAIVTVKFTVTWIDGRELPSKPKFVESRVNLPETATLNLPGLPLTVAADLYALMVVAPTSTSASLSKLAQSIAKNEKTAAAFDSAKQKFIAELTASTRKAPAKAGATKTSDSAPRQITSSGTADHANDLADSNPADLMNRLVKNIYNIGGDMSRVGKDFIAEIAAGTINVPAEFNKYADGLREKKAEDVKFWETFVDNRENYSRMRDWLKRSPSSELYRRFSLHAAAKAIQSDMRNHVSNVDMDIEVVRPIYDLLARSDSDKPQCACDYNRQTECKNPSKHGAKLSDRSIGYVKTCVQSLNATLTAESWKTIPQDLIDAWAKLS